MCIHKKKEGKKEPEDIDRKTTAFMLKFKYTIHQMLGNRRFSMYVFIIHSLA
jgi:hypothetical protein